MSKPNCFGNYKHKDFCFDAGRQRKRSCLRQSECFSNASDKLYFYRRNIKRECGLCGKKTRFYEVENMLCWTVELNLYAPSLSKTFNEHVEWLEHPICPKCFTEGNQLMKVPKEWNRFCGMKDEVEQE